MILNKFLWKNYLETEGGKKAVGLFANAKTVDLLSRFMSEYHLDANDSADFIDNLVDFAASPIIPSDLTIEGAQQIFKEIVSDGFTVKFGEEIEEFRPDEVDFLHLVPIISTWLFYSFPDYFKPYFFRLRFQLLTQIADSFGLELPVVPLKRNREERLLYYWKLCQSFYEFQLRNEMTAFEFCAFLYDFAPSYVEQSQVRETELPKATQVWMVGGDKGGNDFKFLDNYEEGNTSFWQGNVDTKFGDIIIMYCLSPRSFIHSVWRATKDGIADPFFHYYSSIYISKGIKVAPITLQELKVDEHFSKHPLVRKNFQGVNGYLLNHEDYRRIQELIVKNGGSTIGLPQLYSPNFELNQALHVERDVELNLVEPFLKELGYSEQDWERQLSVRMGRGERNFPDYAFLTSKERNYEIASMLIEVKFWIRNNKDLEETFKQVYSYGLRLSAKILVIGDKEAIWIYEKHNVSFDRSRYIKKYWKELEMPDEFARIKKMLGPK